MLNELTILYVEDEELMQEVIRDFFSSIFKDLICVHNGKVGLETFVSKQTEIDLIITDINMPIMNGLEMSEKIRELNDSIPIIFVTAHNENNYLYKAIKMGISDFIIKPI